MWPDKAQRALQSAIELREAMYQVFWAIVQRKPVPRLQLSILNGFVQESGRHMNLVPAVGHLEWKFESGTTDFDAPLWPLARSAAELLASDQLQFVRACASKTCEWLFLDTSKSHRRRWCDMTKCGNRAKAKSFYTRSRRAAK
jgi:predicted RNA-binding Zn ribbon-like protein